MFEDLKLEVRSDHEPKERERWVIAVDGRGMVSVLGLPDVEYDVTYDVEEMGLPEDLDFPAGVYSVGVDLKCTASDYEMPWILDEMERNVDEDDVIILWQPDIPNEE